VIIGDLIEIDVMEVDPSSMAEYLEELEREEKKQERIANCGTWRHRPDPSTGKQIAYQIRCGYWRECHRCFKRRKEEEFEARYSTIRTSVSNVGVTVAKNESRAKSVVRYLRRKGRRYWRIPVEGGEYVILYDADAGEILPQADIELDWDTLAKTPPGTRYSGSLGKPEKDDEEEYSERFIVPVPEYSISLPDHVSLKECTDAMMDATSDLDPDFDPQDISFACWVRATTLKEIIVERGGEVFGESTVFIAVTDKSYKRWRDRDNPTQEIPRVDAQTAIEELFEL